MARLKRTAGLVVLLLAGTTIAGHTLGLSLAYFLPRGGRFSHPVAPLSIRDISLSLGRYFGVAGSLALYDIRGMAIKDEEGQPIDTGDPAAGPFLSVLGSVAAKVFIPVKNFELTAGGGVFGCYNIDPRLDSGVLDRYLAESTTYQAVVSDLTAGGRWGWGFLFVAGATYYIKGQIGISIGANYYLGAAALGLSGTFDGYDGLSPTPITENIADHALSKARLDYTGFELIAGLNLRL